MAADVSSDVAGIISGSKVFGGSENIRHGRYKFVIKRIFADLVDNDQGKHRMAFWELSPISAEPNPQVEGDHTDYPGTTGPLKDDGMHPNGVGSNCALKVDFDGPGARSAGSNIKAPMLALFNKREGEISDAEVNSTWLDLSRQKDLRVGDAVGIDPATNQVIKATEDKKANPACGMVIYCTTLAKRKKTANDKGAYVTKLIWSCVAPLGTGENSFELITKRRAEIESARIEEDEEAATAAAAAPAPTAPPSMFNGGGVTNGHAVPAFGVPPAPAPATQAVAPLPPPPPAPPVPPAPPAVFTPPAPWRIHTTAPKGDTPETRWFWDGGNGVKSEAQLRVEFAK